MKNLLLEKNKARDAFLKELISLRISSKNANKLFHNTHRSIEDI